MDERIKNALLGFISVALSLSVALIAFELYVRLVETDGSNFDIEMWRYARDLKRVSQVAGVGHEHVPGKRGVYMGVPVGINSVGWRDREHPVEKPHGVIRIMMLGDSLTFGWGARPEDVTSYRLERLLNEREEGRYEVLNTGIGNANTAMEVAYFLNVGYVYNPDIVVLNYFINDAEETPHRKTNPIMENSYAAVYLAGRIDIVMRRHFGRSDWQKYYRDLYQDDQPGWLAARNALRSLSVYCKNQGIKLVVVHYPELHQLSPYPFRDITNLVSAEAQRVNAPFLDLLPTVAQMRPTTLWVTKTDAHPNGKAAERYAAAITKFLTTGMEVSPQ